MPKIGYRKLKRYKYQLMEDYTMSVDIKPENDILETDFIILTVAGELTIDTKSFMRASLVHDVLYQLMREECLDQTYRSYADKLLRKICLEDGMWRFRALYLYYGLRLFAKRAAKPSPKRRGGMLYAP